jgi:hypothetical protein
MRVPRTTGLPLHTAGLSSIRPMVENMPRAMGRASTQSNLGMLGLKKAQESQIQRTEA